MSLTANDLNEIRAIIDSAFVKHTDEVIKPIKDELQALRNDIKEIYGMLKALNNKDISDSDFDKLSLEKKILELNTKLISAAKQAGITLPR